MKQRIGIRIFLTAKSNVSKTSWLLLLRPMARPVLDDLLSWLESGKAAPKSGLGKAVYCTLEQWKYLARYLEDGWLEIGNNRAERSIKPFIIDRKNFLFSNTPRGVNSGTVVLSLIETAKENWLGPYKYLTYIFKNALNWGIRNCSEKPSSLLPRNVPTE